MGLEATRPAVGGVTYARPAATASAGFKFVPVQQTRPPRPASPAAPVITTQPSGLTAIAGQTVTFSVVATGGVGLTHQWRAGGAAVDGATSATYTLCAPRTSVVLSCVVTNSAGVATVSADALLTVVREPVITSSPRSVVAVLGTAVSFAVETAGVGLSHQWQRDGIDLVDARGPTYAFRAPRADYLSSSAVYCCVVSNIAGSVTSAPATLAVVVPPVVLVEPEARTAEVGSSSTFCISPTLAVGDGQSYQWQRNGVAIDGATNVAYTTPPATKADLAASPIEMRCRVTNEAGATVSKAALWTITPAAKPAISTQPVSQSAAPGTSVVFSVVASGVPSAPPSVAAVDDDMQVHDPLDVPEDDAVAVAVRRVAQSPPDAPADGTAAHLAGAALAVFRGLATTWSGVVAAAATRTRGAGVGVPSVAGLTFASVVDWLSATQTGVDVDLKVARMRRSACACRGVCPTPWACGATQALMLENGLLACLSDLLGIAAARDDGAEIASVLRFVLTLPVRHARRASSLASRTL
jgi:hypothetical protein